MKKGLIIAIIGLVVGAIGDRLFSPDKFKIVTETKEITKLDTAYVSIVKSIPITQTITQFDTVTKNDTVYITKTIASTKEIDEEWDYKSVPSNFPYATISGKVYTRPKLVETMLRFNRHIYLTQPKMMIGLDIPLLKSPIIDVSYRVKKNWWLGIGTSFKLEDENLKLRLHLRGALTF